MAARTAKDATLSNRTIVLMENLRKKVTRIQALMVSVATGGGDRTKPFAEVIAEKDEEYRQFSKEIEQLMGNLRQQGFNVANPNPFESLVEFKAHWDLHNMGWEERRQCVRDMYAGLHQALSQQIQPEEIREGVFFEGQYFDALRHIAEILSRAQQNIAIIDGYVDASVLDLLTSKASRVEVRILTKQVNPALRTAAIAFNKQYGNLSIRTSQAFHDRFVFVDDQHFFHFGASIKDAGHRGFMFSRIEEQFVIDALRGEWAKEWASAKVEV